MDETGQITLKGIWRDRKNLTFKDIIALLGLGVFNLLAAWGLWIALVELVHITDAM